MKPELKICPFCGGKAQIAPDEIGSGGQHVPPYHAGCFRGSGCGFTFTADDPDEAIAAWNRRATITLPDMDGLVNEAEAAQEWMREPDWADDFNLSDMAAWLNKRPTSLLPRLIAALTAERAAHAETKRERDEAHDREMSAVIGETEATKRAEAYRAQRDEALKALEPFAKIKPSTACAEDGSEAEPYRVFLAARDDFDFTGADLAAARRALEAQGGE